MVSDMCVIFQDKACTTASTLRELPGCLICRSSSQRFATGHCGTPHMVALRSTMFGKSAGQFRAPHARGR